MEAVLKGNRVALEQCLFSNYEQFFLLPSGVWKGACVFIYFGECCETVHKFFVKVLHSTGVLCSSNINVISCSWKLKSFYSRSSWSYSFMLQVVSLVGLMIFLMLNIETYGIIWDLYWLRCNSDWPSTYT